ncbi:MAG: radical SAM protein [Thermoprotei archaeon]|nr:MAG: radical SAM protein [Thermoprotei archaeon]
MVKSFYPLLGFPSISITGEKCALNCEYCEAKILKQMLSANSPKKLEKILQNLSKRGIRGALISGGFTKEGKLPVKRYLTVIKQYSRKMVFSMHTLSVNEEEASLFRDAGIRIVDIPVSLDPIVLSKIRKLENFRVEDLRRSLYNLLESGPQHIVPHIMIGERYGKIVYEKIAIDFVSELSMKLVVFLVIYPYPGTSFYMVNPPSSNEILDILRYARKKMDSEIALGCMRPPEVKKRVDDIALREQFIDRIVAPLSWIEKKYDAERYKSCCSVPENLLLLFRMD